MFDQSGNPFSVYGFEVWGNRLIFSGNYLGKMWTSALLGCFNMDTLEIEWTEPVPIDKGEFVAEAPVVAGNKIYLGTSESTLFVYEMVDEL
jgi:outer membrane protein assembly factor BamB